MPNHLQKSKKCVQTNEVLRKIKLPSGNESFFVQNSKLLHHTVKMLTIIPQGSLLATYIIFDRNKAENIFQIK